MEDFQPMAGLKLEPYQGNANMLMEIFIKQQYLFTKYKWATQKSSIELTQLYAQCIASEAQELMNQTQWKPWKKQGKDFDRGETIFEYIDILHFVVNGLIALNVDEQECMIYYMAKHRENLRRIKDGY